MHHISAFITTIVQFKQFSGQKNLLIKIRLLFYDLGLIGIQEVLQKEKETKQIKCNVPCSAGG